MIPDSFSYDGTEKKPTVLVTYQYGTEVEVRQLTEGSDFTVAYSNNINAGTATAVISGIGNYTGSRTVEYTITEKSFLTERLSRSRTELPIRIWEATTGGGTGSAGNTGRQCTHSGYRL